MRSFVKRIIVTESGEVKKHTEILDLFASAEMRFQQLREEMEFLAARDWKLTLRYGERQIDVTEKHEYPAPEPSGVDVWWS